MDPMSMTASIVAILQLTTTLTGYINDVRHATAEQAKVAVEASNLYSLLTSLRFRVEAVRAEDPWFTQVRMLGIHNGPLDQFKEILERMVEQLSSSTSRKRDQMKSALMWKFTKSEVENALKTIERLKSLISCALTGDLLTLSQATHDDVVALKEQTEILHIRTERLQGHIDQELQNKLSRWLSLPDPSTNFHAALEKRHPETGLWFVNGHRFDSWRNSPFSFMWLHGNAGCGKTVLSAASLQEITQSKKTQSHIVVSYFFFDFNDAEKQSSEKAIRSLLFQFTLQQQKRLQILEDLYQRCGKGQQQPAEHEMRSLLKDAVACTGSKYIILDALDECTNREDFMVFIDELIHSQPEGLRIMITSRREKDIEEQLGSIADHDINIQSAIVDEDIRIYVHNRLATDKKFKKWPEKVQEGIVAVLMKKADGMFRWAYCQLESIRHCVKLSALQKALSTLPKDLYATYDRILQGLESVGHRQDAIKALRWLCFSNRPLHLSEMIEVLAIECGESGGFCPNERLPDPDDIMVICSSLISCSREADDTQIRLAHFSVKEYLLSDQCLFALDFQMPACHMAIAEGCLHYLLYLYERLPLAEDLVEQHPLSRYAAKYWWQHARASDQMLNCTVINLARNLFMNKDVGVLPWIQLYDIDDPWRNSDLSLSMEEVAPPLYYAASIGLLQVVENILSQIVDINAKGGRNGNALQSASAKGHEKIVQVLLDAGADVSPEGKNDYNALEAACRSGYEKVVQILVDAGADVNAKGYYYENSLEASSVNGYENIVRILLDAGADVHGYALEPACRHGHEKVVQMLVDAGADFNAKGMFSNPLNVASFKGYKNIVQILLNAGADVHGYALETACSSGHEKVVQILVDAGADVNAEGINFKNALEAASVKPHKNIVQILLKAGAKATA